MRLTTKCRHAVTALIHLANRSNEQNTVSLAEISAIQGVSISYLEQLFSKMRQAELVIGTRGPGGGYRLNKPAEQITIADIADAIDDRCRKERLEAFGKPCPDKRNFAQFAAIQICLMVALIADGQRVEFAEFDHDIPL